MLQKIKVHRSIREKTQFLQFGNLLPVLAFAFEIWLIFIFYCHKCFPFSDTISSRQQPKKIMFFLYFQFCLENKSKLNNFPVQLAELSRTNSHTLRAAQCITMGWVISYKVLLFLFTFVFKRLVFNTYSGYESFSNISGKYMNFH